VTTPVESGNVCLHSASSQTLDKNMKKIIRIVLCVSFGLISLAKVYGDTNLTELSIFPCIIPDGSAVVFKKGDIIGVAIISNQSATSESLSYEWYLRTDGKIDFDQKSNAISKGKVKGASSIKFGPFDTWWSINKKGRGFIYLNNDDYYTGVIMKPNKKKLNEDLFPLKMIRNPKADQITLGVNWDILE
jgi:hypothetical protein